ncbi:TetR/AcrR family transcriptional regulator [Streptomyces sp. NPDC021093]|uniref:TetR/AcrR family transcriptional regulator n=1 Tax=Streptomyces sp. NPDC021093 TaxID=3365112 RepID=UPI00379D8A35
MPTGVAIRDVREQLFAAAERVLLRVGPSALTSRAVTDEAGCAKGVLHRHFADFDDFLASLVREHISQLDAHSAELADSAGSGTVADNLTRTLKDLFGPVAVAVVGLVASRDGLRARLRETTPAGLPLLTEATAVLAAYLTAEQARGRIAAEADPDTLAPTLIGTGHLLFADRTGTAPGTETVRRAVIGVLGEAVNNPTDQQTS